MDLWMDGCMDVWMVECMGVWMDGCMYGQMDVWMDAWIYGWMDIWMYGYTDVWMYICMYGCMDGCFVVCMEVWIVTIFCKEYFDVYPSNEIRMCFVRTHKMIERRGMVGGVVEVGRGRSWGCVKGRKGGRRGGEGRYERSGWV